MTKPKPKHPALTLDEHRQIGATLTMIRHECASADRLNQFLKQSTTHRRLRRVEKDIDRLRCKLDSLVCKQYPDVDTRPIYYGNPAPRVGCPVDVPVDAMILCLDNVHTVINGRVPVRILDLWMRAHLALPVLKVVLEDYPEDRRRHAA